VQLDQEHFTFDEEKCRRRVAALRRHSAKRPKPTRDEEVDALSATERTLGITDRIVEVASANSRMVVKTMSRSTRNTGKHWTSGDVHELKQLASQNTPTRVIGLKLGRTPDAVASKASDVGISLKPTNQSPYNRTK
jgi:hypothetical protein